jgi:hypothetical protein
MIASRIDDGIIDGKRKRLSLLVLLRETGQETRRDELDDCVSDIFVDVIVGC